MRREEIRNLMKLSPINVIKKAGDQLRVCKNLDTLHRLFAMDIAEEIQINNKKKKASKFILPVGPIGQYEYLIDIIKSNDIDLSRCYFIFMDEYCDEQGKALDESHPLSFRGIANRLFLSKIPESSNMNFDNIIFPNENNIGDISKYIEDLGGLDVCYGGIGIHGHIAFNEPEADIITKKSRKVKLNDFTITINAIRANVGGNIECFPKEAFTIGFKEILSAKKIMLYCRNGTPYDWANTILRIALFGTTGDDYPVTHIRNRNYIITTDEFTLQTPKFQI